MIKNILPAILTALALSASAQVIKTKPGTITDTTTYTISKATNPFKLIEPGKGIGRIMLNSNAENFVNVMGTPDKQSNTGSLTAMTWFDGHDSTSYALTIYTGETTLKTRETVNRIKQLRITSPNYITMDSLCVGSSLTDIQRIYKMQPGISKGNNHVYDVSASGIAFELNDQKICTAIIVHLPKSMPAVYADVKP